MNHPKLLTDLTKYTDFNKARAYDQLIFDMQAILHMYIGNRDALSSTVSEVIAKLLSHSWDLLLKNGDDSGPINS